MLPPFVSPLIVQLLNALLAREPWARARLRPHAGKVVRLVAGNLDITLAVSATGSVQDARQAAPHATVTVATADLPRLLGADASQRMQAVRLEGEAALAQVMAELARDLRWDVEEDLAGLIGDIPARMLLRSARGAQAALRETASRLGGNAVEYVTYEADLIVPRATLAAWSAEVNALDAEAQSLGERIAALARSKGAA